MSFFVQKLSLSQFRCYDGARMELDNRPVVLSGPNGAGKTNILEALSLLSPGKGLRAAALDEFQNKESSAMGRWGVSVELANDKGESSRIGTGMDPVKNKRIIRIDGENIKKQSALSEYLTVVWLTPQMDGLFLNAPSGRRRFFDHLVAGFIPEHHGRLRRFEKVMKERNLLLSGEKGPVDQSWLKSLEETMAETAVVIAASRKAFIERLHQATTLLTAQPENYFPVPRIEIEGFIEEALEKSPALEVEELYKEKLKECRQEDANRGGTSLGIHRSDFKTYHAPYDMAADQCSTGEQKALLISIILSNARLLQAERGRVPIMLLDEVTVHLDENRRKALFDILINFGQFWVTGLEENEFRKILGDKAQYFKIESARIMPRSMEYAA